MKQIKNNLIIDCQVLQTGSWHRGMGKYSLAFLDALSKNEQFEEENEVYFLFNRNIEENLEIHELIKAKFPRAKFLDINLELPKEPRSEFSIAPIITANKNILNQLISSEFSGDVDFLILALYLDEVCPVFPDTAQNKALIYYDSIPYLYHERYGKFSGFFEHFYLPHTATLYEANKIFTISETVANDLHVMLGVPADSIFNIGGASIPRQNNKVSKPDLTIEQGKFILMPTGQELRKNNTRAVRAFEQFRLVHNPSVKLVITSNFTEEAKTELRAISEQIIFSGNVSEGEMLWLFRNCRFVFFPSEYEGLGLPILEAVEQNKPIACSDISVFREMSMTAFNYFDPLHVDSIASTLKTVDELSENWQPPLDTYSEISARYAWDNTVQTFIDALKKERFQEKITKIRVAIFCPDPAGFSAIGKVIIESHAWYSRYFDITYYFDKGPNHEKIRPNPLPFLTACYAAEDFKANDYDKYDAIIYHIGNSEYHLNTIHTALAFPGYVVLHDTYLDGAYSNLIEEGYISKQRAYIEKRIDNLLPDNDQLGKTRSADLTSIVNNQYGIVTHSQYAKEVVANKLINKGVKVEKINLPVDTPLFENIVHGTSDKLNIAFAGIIAKVKGTDIIENIALSRDFADCHINIFGYSAVEPERLERIRALPHVNLITNPSDYEYQKLMASTDILINVRIAYQGETSLTTLEGMRYGATVMVRSFGWYSELPSDTVKKIEDPSQALDVLHHLVADTEGRKKTGTAAIKYIRKEHSHQAYAKEMYKFIEDQ